MFHKIPRWFQNFFSGYTWCIKSTEKIIYLTFDDGPIPGITEWVLDVLDTYKAKASFFVVGENVGRHPELLKKIFEQGHTIGNHTFNHVKGWEVSADVYEKSVEKCSDIIKANSGEYPNFFRPPYGRIKPSQAKILRKKYELVMWSVLSVDYNKGLARHKCLRNTINASKSGAIVVFHDSVKAEKNLKYVLPNYLKHFAQKGYTFKSL